MRKHMLLTMAAGLALGLAAQAAQAAEKIKIGFLPGRRRPVLSGHAARRGESGQGPRRRRRHPDPADLGRRGADADPRRDGRARRPQLHHHRAVDRDQMVGPLKAAVDHGIKIITVDTYLGDGDYVKGPVKFPLSYIGSDNVEGGRIAAEGLAKAIGGKGTVYINSTNPNVSSVEGRAKRLQGADGGQVSRHQGRRARLQPRRPNKATQQTAAVMAREKISRACSAPTCSAPKAPARRWSTPASAAGAGRRLRRH